MSDVKVTKPSIDELRKELKRENSKKEYKKVLRNTLIVVIVVAALAARISAPRKGDRPEQLSAEYDALAAQLREKKF